MGYDYFVEFGRRLYTGFLALELAGHVLNSNASGRDRYARAIIAMEPFHLLEQFRHQPDLLVAAYDLERMAPRRERPLNE